MAPGARRRGYRGPRVVAPLDVRRFPPVREASEPTGEPDRSEVDYALAREICPRVGGDPEAIARIIEASPPDTRADRPKWDYYLSRTIARVLADSDPVALFGPEPPRLPPGAYATLGEVSRRVSRFKSVADLEGRPVPPREWLVPDLIPANTVTILGGDGGTGKSLLAAQLATAVALGLDWIGHPVQRGRALYLSAEDDRNELHRRFFDIARSRFVTLGKFGNLTFRSLAGEGALLITETLETTPLFAELDAWIADARPSLVVLDTLADLHAVNENDRNKARHVIDTIRGLAIRHQTTIVLLAHPSLSGLTSGEGSSGSTAWNNSVRSRLYFHRVKEEVDPDIRILTTKKANYGPIGAETRVRWQAGVFVPVGMADVPGETRQARAERVFLKLLREHIDLGVFLKFGKSSQNYAPKVFAQHPSSEGIKIFEFSRAMDNLRKDGKITTFQVGKNRNGKHEIHVWLPELSAAPLEPPPFSPLENAPFPFTQRGTDK